MHRELSRKKKGSKNREKARIKLSRFYEKNNDLIVVEDLKIKNMLRNNKLSRYIQDASWGEFIMMLSYKADEAGKVLKKVGPKGTSEDLGINDPYRDYISANRVLNRGRDCPDKPVERGLLLRNISYKDFRASLFSEAGSPLRKRGVVHLCENDLLS